MPSAQEVTASWRARPDFVKALPDRWQSAYAFALARPDVELLHDRLVVRVTEFQTVFPGLEVKVVREAVEVVGLPDEGSVQVDLGGLRAQVGVDPRVPVRDRRAFVDDVDPATAPAPAVAVAAPAPAPPVPRTAPEPRRAGVVGGRAVPAVVPAAVMAAAVATATRMAAAGAAVTRMATATGTTSAGAGAGPRWTMA